MSEIIKDNLSNLPRHVAIVPDGNRRWAEKKGLKPWRGHLAGAEKTREQVQAAFDLGLKCLTWWGGSYGNLTKRAKTEISNLFKIYEKYFNELAKKKEIHKYEVKVSILGRWAELLPQSGIKAAKNLMEVTKDYNQRWLNFMIAYDGQDEMIEAIKGIAQKARESHSVKVDEDLLRKYLWTGFLPPVDLLIRTGSADDPHNSAGFMMWNCANSQLYFSKEFYPDFGKKEFIKAIQEYQRRERRLGK